MLPLVEDEDNPVAKETDPDCSVLAPVKISTSPEAEVEDNPEAINTLPDVDEFELPEISDKDPLSASPSPDRTNTFDPDPPLKPDPPTMFKLPA